MNKYVFFCVRSVDEAVSALDVEPFHNATYFGGDNLFSRLGLALLTIGHLFGCFDVPSV